MKHRDFGFEIKEVGLSGTFSGYGNIYDVIDQGDDIVQAGAFADSLKGLAAKGRMPALLWQHDSREPIGAYTSVKEDSTGLFVAGQLCMDTQRGAEAYALLKMKAVSGMSIGFLTRADTYDQKTGIRTITKADLWECSIVTFPMNDDSRVSSIKAFDEIVDLKSAEHYLRESGSFSRSEATAIVARIKSLGQRDSGVDEEAKALIAALSRRMELLKN